MTMKPEIQVLVALAEEAKRMESEAVEAKETKLASMLNFRRQEIAGVLSVAQTWDNDPPINGIDPQEDLEAYEKATLYVANAIKVLMESQVSMGGHQNHFEKEWQGRIDWKE